VQQRTNLPIGCDNNERDNEKSTRYDENNERYKRYNEYTQENNSDGDRRDALHSRSDGIIGTGKLDDGPLADHEDLPGSKRADYPNFPFPELQKIVTPHIYSYQQYLVYMLEIPLFSPTQYHLYKLLPFPVKLQQQGLTCSYIGFNKKFIFSDSLRQHYGKLTANELTG
jgi:hypothetical protein